jgi:hypothetical protein
MKIEGFQKHIFWSYADHADLPETLIAKQVILFGEISDMILLSKRVDPGIIENVLQSLAVSGRNKKRIHFFQKVILD